MSRLFSTNIPRKAFLKIFNGNPQFTRNLAGPSIFEPAVPFLEKPSVVFSPKAVCHHWGAIPIIVITAIGLTLDFLALARLALTRDDVYYTKRAHCDYVETYKGAKVPCRKLLVFNQKYENPPGLIEAMQGGDINAVYKSDGPGDENQGFSKKFLAAHTVASAAVIYMSLLL